ncbi:hypothetical protein PTSG_12475, partial [Salpingoeca rosetta]
QVRTASLHQDYSHCSHPRFPWPSPYSDDQVSKRANVIAPCYELQQQGQDHVAGLQAHVRASTLHCAHFYLPAGTRRRSKKEQSRGTEE